MENKKAIIIVLSIILAIFLFALLFVVFKDVYYNSVIINEVKQTEFLYNIVEEIAKKENIVNIKLDDSMLRNIITQEEFPDELKNKMLSLENNIDTEEITYTFSCVYSEYANSLLVIITNDKPNSNLSGESTSYNFKLIVKNNKITYETSTINISIS